MNESNLIFSSDGTLVVFVQGCSMEKDIPFSNLMSGSSTMDWYFIKTAEEFQVWCQGKMVSVKILNGNFITI